MREKKVALGEDRMWLLLILLATAAWAAAQGMPGLVLLALVLAILRRTRRNDTPRRAPRQRAPLPRARGSVARRNGQHR